MSTLVVDDNANRDATAFPRGHSGSHEVPEGLISWESASELLGFVRLDNVQLFRASLAMEGRRREV